MLLKALKEYYFHRKLMVNYYLRALFLPFLHSLNNDLI